LRSEPVFRVLPAEGDLVDWPMCATSDLLSGVNLGVSSVPGEAGDSPKSLTDKHLHP
jgi:hypothetical protein